MAVEISRKLRNVDYGVSKMYWKSKKNVYGIANESELVESIHRLLNQVKVFAELKPGEEITHKIIYQAFGSKIPSPYLDKKEQKDIESLALGPQLDLDIYLALKIEGYIK